MTFHRHGRIYCIVHFTAVLLFHVWGADADTANNRTLSPYFFVKSSDPYLDQLPLKASHTDVTISGVITEVTLEQIYENEGSRPLEAIYVFPASTLAAIHAMKMTVGNRIIEAQIKKRDQARATYEKAKEDGKSAALLEQKRPNVFQMSVANILPGDRIRVSLSYTELIAPTEGTYELVVPTVVGPRYSTVRESEATAEASWIESPFLQEGEQPTFEYDFRLSVNTPVPLAKVTSPSHDIDVVFDDPESARISLSGSDAANRDVVIRYVLAGEKIQTGLLTYEDDKENYFLMMMEPPARTTPRQIVGREHIFVVDISGSMRGFPLDTTKKLMQQVLSDLTPHDFFNVLLFAGGSQAFSSRSVRASKANIGHVMRWISKTQGGGGTELLGALTKALALPKQPNVTRIVTVVTDGYVSVEQEAYALIRKNLGRANLFCFGIGTSVNRELIEILARAGSGEPFVVLNPAEATATAKRFHKYVQAPVLRNISVDFADVDVYDVEPVSLPDLFAFKPLALFGKYRGELDGRIFVKGQGGDGRFRKEIALNGSGTSTDNLPLKYLWARSRIRALSDEEALDHRESSKKAITRLGLDYHLMTRYTSFVAVDSVVRNIGGKQDRVEQPSPLPAGVPASAIPADSPSLSGLLGPSFGYGGLGIRGTGRGGGGVGIGTIGHGSGSGRGSGYGRSAGGLGGRRGAAPKIRSGAPVVKGSLSKEVVRRIVHRHINEVKFCYERELHRVPELKGSITVKFIVTAAGVVASASVEKTTMNNPAVEQCILAAVRRWTFPAPEGGGSVTIQYPFVFEK